MTDHANVPIGVAWHGTDRCDRRQEAVPTRSSHINTEPLVLRRLTMSVVPKAEPEPISNVTTNQSHRFDRVVEKERRSVDQPQSELLPNLVAPNKAATLFVLGWIAVIAAAAGSVIWAALANPA